MSILSNAKLQEAIDKSPSHVRVTDEIIEKRIARVEFIRLPKTTVTICHVILDNGYSVRGESACVDPKNYNKDIGETYARKAAIQKLYPLFAFLLAEMKFVAGAQTDEYGFLKATSVADGD